MSARHLELLVEELSMEAFLRALLPRLLPANRTFDVHSFQGKSDLLAKLESRLRGYAGWLPDEWRIVVVVDRDEEDCLTLKQQLESAAKVARLHTRSRAGAASWHVVNRIAIEELEAWYFGDWTAVCNAFRACRRRSRGRRGFAIRMPSAAARGRRSSASCKTTGISRADYARWRRQG